VVATKAPETTSIVIAGTKRAALNETVLWKLHLEKVWRQRRQQQSVPYRRYVSRRRRVQNSIVRERGTFGDSGVDALRPVNSDHFKCQIVRVRA
jgi:hypothetical protein